MEKIVMHAWQFCLQCYFPLFLHKHSHLSSEITRGIVHNNLYIDRVLISLAYC